MQHAYKVVVKSEPVKKSQPVERYLQIINLFSEGNEEAGLGSNDIWRLTGRTDKQQVCSDIKSLVNSHILSSQRKQRKQTGFKDPKFLTKLGKEIRQFIIDMDNFEKSSVKLQEAVNNHFNVEPHSPGPIYLDEEHDPDQPYEIRTMPPAMRNKFRANGWSDEEMIDYANCYRAVYWLLLDRTVVVNAMMSRYSDIIMSNGLAVSNRVGNMPRIMNQILLKYIGKQLEITTGRLSTDGRALRSRYHDGGIIFSGALSVERYFEHLAMEGVLKNKYISREVKGLLGAILFILRPHISYIESPIDYIKKVAPHRIGNSERLNSLLILYEDIIKRLR